MSEYLNTIHKEIDEIRYISIQLLSISDSYSITGNFMMADVLETLSNKLDNVQKSLNKAAHDNVQERLSIWSVIMSYKYGGYLISTRGKFIRAVCQGWLTADGLNNTDTVIESLNTITPKQFAEECWDGLFQNYDNKEELTILELEAEFKELNDDRKWIEQNSI